MKLSKCQIWTVIILAFVTMNHLISLGYTPQMEEKPEVNCELTSLRLHKQIMEDNNKYLEERVRVLDGDSKKYYQLWKGTKNDR